MPRARPGSRLAGTLLAVAVLLGACASPSGRDDETSDVPRDDLAEAAEGDVTEPPEAPPEPAAGETSTTIATGGTGASGGSGSTSGSGGGSAPEVILNVSDRGGDADTLVDDSPAYADALQLTVETIGADARITVRVGASLPAALADGEVVGLGVDLYRSRKLESDYQLFADGGADGWRAFLQTPEGFLDYPGTFAVSGSLVQFRVPWSALGGQPAGTVKGFLDWSGSGSLGLNASTTDSVPDRAAAFP